MFKFQQKPKYIKEKVKKWNRDSFGNIFEEKSRLENELELQRKVMEVGCSNKLKAK